MIRLNHVLRVGAQDQYGDQLVSADRSANSSSHSWYCDVRDASAGGIIKSKDVSAWRRSFEQN